jgi:hypothetical protein
MTVLIICSWIFFHNHYKTKLADIQDVIVGQVGENNTVLSELTKANRRLELSKREDGSKVLLIRNSKGWTTLENHGVITFK